MKSNKIETINANAKVFFKEIDDLIVDLRINLPPSREAKIADYQLRLFKDYYSELLKDVNAYSKIPWLWIPLYGNPYQLAIEKMMVYEKKTKQQLEKIKIAKSKLINLQCKINQEQMLQP